MEKSRILYWVTFIVSIAFAVIASDQLSSAITNQAGLTGPLWFLVNFILFAVLFFGILWVIGRLTGMTFFGCVR